MLNFIHFQTNVSICKFLSWQRCVTPLSVAKGLFEVEEEVAHEFALLKDQIKDTLAENPTSHLSPVTVNIWSKIIYYCKIHVDPSTAEISFDPQFVRQLDLVGLFNLSQVFLFLLSWVSFCVYMLVYLTFMPVSAFVCIS